MTHSLEIDHISAAPAGRPGGLGLGFGAVQKKNKKKIDERKKRWKKSGAKMSRGK